MAQHKVTAKGELKAKGIDAKSYRVDSVSRVICFKNYSFSFVYLHGLPGEWQLPTDTIKVGDKVVIYWLRNWGKKSKK